MKYATCLLALTFAAASPAFAQTSSSSSAAPHFAPAPPPPGMNDPGVNPSREPVSSSTSASAPVSSPAELEPSHMESKPIPMPKMSGAPAGQDANGQPPPDVQVHQEGDNTIQVYRQNGHVYMVVVTPKVGPQQIYNVNPDGHMLDPNGQPPVKPVMYKIMQWGNSKPASASSSDDNGS
jgi:Protein of unknown function (DUF2782)